ncbi:hypothetical protein N656DRAFT_847528 [Canariomyces notabilis]|uniref:Uncharacterized protein n=1 Tax=Canariomyces notabilis TaxID=2074819 RepID=A0AAN6QNK4_9PEZI|nr:hypothetical protein N656DRAFT_847528 [Canariomyces arenarius]
MPFHPSLHLPLLFHLLIETPASISFIFFPKAQLLNASPDAILISRNLGGLLLAINLVCLVFLTGGESYNNQLVAKVSLCFATYHVWPAHRAYVRLARGPKGRREEQKVLGGPVVHLVVHLGCLISLFGGGLMGIMS